jgi:N-acetyl-gamma-glutamyl-phosphate reductase
MNNKIKASIIGASGYAGGEIARLLLKHPNIEISHLIGETSAGTSVIETHQNLFELATRKFESLDLQQLADDGVIFMALPHGKSGEIANQLEGFDGIIIDIAADHRLKREADWTKYYMSEYQGCWTYGFPELGTAQREIINNSTKIAIPGCNVTAVTLAYLPLVKNNLISLNNLTAVLANGYSGAGKTLKQDLLAAEGINTAKPYAVGGIHRHIPEIRQNLAQASKVKVSSFDDIKISFTPTLVPMVSGILATCISNPIAEIPDLQKLYEEFYSSEQFVNVLPEGINATTAAVAGTNYANIQVAYDETSETITTIVAIDNLVRGTAGTAIQCMNLALGFAESAGL